jgi:hypothetical protein
MEKLKSWKSKSYGVLLFLIGWFFFPIIQNAQAPLAIKGDQTWVPAALEDNAWIVPGSKQRQFWSSIQLYEVDGQFYLKEYGPGVDLGAYEVQGVIQRSGSIVFRLIRNSQEDSLIVRELDGRIGLYSLQRSYYSFGAPSPWFQMDDRVEGNVSQTKETSKHDWIGTYYDQPFTQIANGAYWKALSISNSMGKDSVLVNFIGKLVRNGPSCEFTRVAFVEGDQIKVPIHHRNLPDTLIFNLSVSPGGKQIVVASKGPDGLGGNYFCMGDGTISGNYYSSSDYEMGLVLPRFRRFGDELDTHPLDVRLKECLAQTKGSSYNETICLNAYLKEWEAEIERIVCFLEYKFKEDREIVSALGSSEGSWETYKEQSFELIEHLHENCSGIDCPSRITMDKLKLVRSYAVQMLGYCQTKMD